MKLTIVIPAFNEDEAIGSTIRRCLDARATIKDRSPVMEVEIIVVSDGSTDKTAEIAATFSEVRLIEFERNRGYGAAIKEGFERGSGDIVGFLDADGTCDPLFFTDLCNALVAEDASVAIGSRMGPGSRMPRIRRIGNRLYATILSALSNKVVTDTASGMRVIRRAVLDQLYPLPDGLHFTPAMSARVLMDTDLKIVEQPMAYEERIGDSKLHVLGDGVRFLHTIFQMSLMWRSAKLFHAMSLLCAVGMILLALHPLEDWMRYGRFGEGMIYRLLTCAFLGGMAMALLSAGVIADHFQRLIRSCDRPGTFLGALCDKVYSLSGFAMACLVATPLIVWLAGEAIRTRITDGYIDTHWSRFVLAGLMVFGLVQMLATVLIANIIRFHTKRSTRTAAGQTGIIRLVAQSTSSGRSVTVHRPVPTPDSSSGLGNPLASADVPRHPVLP